MLSQYRHPRRDPIASEAALLAYRNARQLAKDAYGPATYRRASDAYFVAADAFEAEGVADLAITLRQRARALARQASPRKAFPVKAARTRRIYVEERARGRPAAEAYRVARERQEGPRVVGHVGDVNWPDEEGGPILKSADGSYSLEYVIPPEDDEEDGLWTVYQTDLDKEPLPDWVDARGVAASSGTSASILRKAWNSPNPHARAFARMDVAGYHGWNNLDDYPLRLTRQEVEERYGRQTAAWTG